MSVLRISLFGGIVPRIANRGLPDNAAQLAMNANLSSGELRAWNRTKALASVPVGSATVYHYKYTGLDRYLPFASYTSVVKAPLVNEQLGRIYWTTNDGTGAFVNTAARIETALPAYKLGIPKATGTFGVTPSGGTAALAQTRVYLTTVISAWGEESTPSTPVTVSGNSDGTWTVTGLDTLTIDTAGYPNITTLRLYRTVTSGTGVDYRKVAEWAVGARPASYSDTVTATAISTATALAALGWDPPPAGLKGLIGVAGGFLAGYVGRTVYLSVPYQPHAWPIDYQFAVEDDIVALGSVGNTIVVATVGRAFLLVGPSPDAMALQKLDGVQPCLSARSLVSTQMGVTYASNDGLVLVDGSNRGQIISKPWVTKNEWLARFSPATQMASVYQDRYFAFYNAQYGLTMGFDDPVTGLTELQLDLVSSVDLDPLTGQTLVTANGVVYEWDGDNTAQLTYLWRSKPFLSPNPVNYGVMQLRGNFAGAGASSATLPAQGIGGYSMNSQAIGAGKTPSAKYGGSLNGPPEWLALGTSVSLVGTGPEISVKLYGDGVLRWFGTISTEKVQRLPSGYKAVLTEIEVQGIAGLYSIALAETGKDLASAP